jgi:hypothetical protein
MLVPSGVRRDPGCQGESLQDRVAAEADLPAQGRHQHAGLHLLVSHLQINCPAAIKGTGLQDFIEFFLPWLDTVLQIC